MTMMAMVSVLRGEQDEAPIGGPRLGAPNSRTLYTEPTESANPTPDTAPDRIQQGLKIVQAFMGGM